MANTLFLLFDGPLQSWGERARWTVRDTSQEPTKSGIVGLLACALGWSMDQQLRHLDSSIRVGVRCDRPGFIIRDYHTVVGGVLSADGKIKKTAATKRLETVVSQRYYLADARFLVAVQSDPTMIEHLSAAVQDPIWPYYLGRKSCPAAAPVFAGLGDFELLEDALSSVPVKAEHSEDVRLFFRSVIECSPQEPDAVRRRDAVASRRQRTFNPRYVCERLIEAPIESEEV